MRSLTLTVITLALAGCGDPPIIGLHDLAGTTDLAAVDGGALPDLVPAAGDAGDGGPMCDPPTMPANAVIVTAAYPSPSGGLNTLKLTDKSTTKGIDNTLDADTVVRAAGGKVYTLFRIKGVLRIYDPAAGFAKPVEISTGDSQVKHDTSDPTDALPIAGTTKIYVAMYANDAAHAVGIVDSAQPTKGVTAWIALPATAKSTTPRPTQLWSCNGLVYVLLEDLDPSFSLTGPGRIAVIDPKTDALVKDSQPAIIQLVGQNPGGGLPYGMTRFDCRCDDVLIADAGDLSGMGKDLGGLERVNLATRTSGGLLMTGTDLGGNLGSIASAGSHLLYAVLGASSNKVITVDPTAKKVLGDAIGPATYIPFVQVTPDNQVFVGVNATSMGMVTTGLYVGPADGSKLSAAPIQFDQPPYGISFY